MSVLKQHRLSRGMTLAQIASTLGVNTNTVHSWEVGRNMPRPKMYPKLARVLGMDPMELTRIITGTPSVVVPQ